jgi:membrane-bound lytic murein transglycosylase D
MQYKISLFAIVLLFLSATSRAQKYEDFVMKPQGHLLKTDTIIVKKGNKQTDDLFACNMLTSGSILPAQDNLSSKPVYKPVPLVGQKPAFGDMEDYVDAFVRQYLHLHDQTLNVVQSRSSSPFSLIDNILAQNNIPKELKYLAVIESALNHNAVSQAGAVGPWQLMESTARMMGLAVNKHRDDRKDWYKSTTAAAKYLQLLYGELDDWLLVIAAYNAGPTPVERAIERTGSHSFWDIKKYLPRETQGHVLAFIATASIFENLNKYIGLGNIPEDFKFDAPPAISDAAKKAASAPKVVFTDAELKSMAVVRISHPISLEMMCQYLDMDIKQIRHWNPDYDLFLYNTYPTEYYSLRIPKDKLEAFIQKQDMLQKKSKQMFQDQNM